MTLRFSIVLLLMLSVLPTMGQVDKAVVAEHFTNSRCSICANRNPDLFQNLDSNPEVLYIAYHPSSPYSTCVFSQHNPAENDDRTSHYNVYGATPRLVVNGEVIAPSTSFGSATLFSNHQGQTTPFSLRITETRFGTDSVAVAVTIKAESAHSEPDARLYLAYVEDTVFYNSPNGEQDPIHVFRDALTDADGALLTLPAVGDSVTFAAGTMIRGEWQLDRMFAMAILQNQFKDVLQAGLTDSVVLQAATNLDRALATQPLRLAPNPAREGVTVEGLAGAWELWNLQGQVLRRGNMRTAGPRQIPVADLPSGRYLIRNGSQKAWLEVR